MLACNFYIYEGKDEDDEDEKEKREEIKKEALESKALDLFLKAKEEFEMTKYETINVVS